MGVLRVETVFSKHLYQHFYNAINKGFLKRG